MLIQENFNKLFFKWLWVLIFAISFAWVESAIVVYLRKIYFNGSFSFPLIVNWKEGKRVFDPLIRIELIREISTIIMLVSVGFFTGKNFIQKFSFFIISFGVWDIFYYIWLNVMIKWPGSLMTWDLLFFVPLPWVGPVITPVLIAFAMLFAGTIIIYYDSFICKIYFFWYDWVLEFVCGILLIVSFCWDWKNILRVPGKNSTYSGIPNPFAWWIYIPVLIISIVYFIIRLLQIVSKNKK